ncbi:MAG: exopolyphosphatase [Actinomycetales bacterium]|nr:exopolyphosphatase [Actinomycetales bacterium]
MVTYAAIDCGTNAVRLLVADLDADGVLHERVRLMEIVRLGEGIDRTGEFSRAALDRTFAALNGYAGVMAEFGVTRARFVATSASRDARNREVFVAGVRERMGIDPEVISGTEEASLSFTGAVRGLPAGLVRSPVLVVDIGGGSTEFVLGTDRPEHSRSVDIGCVRMTERHLHDDPPTARQIEATWGDIEAAVSLAGQDVPFGDARCLVGLAGTVTTVAAMALDLPAYDADVLHGCVIGTDEVAEVTERLLRMTRAERAALPFMHPGRVDVIGGGAMVLLAALRASGQGAVIVSETDILDGIVYTLGPEIS